MHEPSLSSFTPLRVGPLTLRNRFIKAATNEGMSIDGVPSKQLVRFHESMAAGGVAMTTLAYCSVSADGRTLPGQIVLQPDSLPHLRALTDAVHRHGGAASAQITHGGCFTFLRERATPRPLSASGGFNKIGMLSGMFRKQAMRETDMNRVIGEFVQGARLAREAGFDAVEIHMGHGYLLSQFISPLYNKRRDEYGGSLENRLRFPRQVLRAVLDAVGNDMAVLCKYSITEGVRGGNRPDDGVAIARLLEREGAHMLVLSAGMNAESITTMFGSSFPKENRVRPSNPLVAAAMAIQQLREPVVDFRELYLLEHSRRIRQAVELPLAYLGGVTSLQGTQQVLAEGFDALALGRALIAEPDLVAKFADGTSERGICTACNRCVAMMYTPGGTSCVLGAPGDAVLNAQPAAS
ncbi:NADH:flavin oxidoreductase [Stutzerimonas balearica]|uniref:NADH:flavin oxidoreductase n=1 Tax=Stutzerimonas balearica TaxID=74829 RepID=UPI00190B17E7|nr:NADH:flavin oxidoreductase [Stutzerimonas balearica]MBK3748391.1 NADH:flavin oxidoreductase [Stutzerimonas balearica]MBK3826588.1 NADH:flavin oxidoreductase [Stutzerimonas balearica]MBK3856278.1 NADH:flavin oxidoreductase [Stutzerimonas balearica]